MMKPILCRSVARFATLGTRKVKKPMRRPDLGMGCLAALLLSSLASSRLSAAEAGVDLEVATEEGLSLEAPSQWLQALQNLPLDSLRLRAARGGDAPRVEPRGSQPVTHYRVLGVLRTDNQLYLPGGKFRLQDKAGLRRWLSDLQSGRSPGEERSANAFGLSEKALVQVFDALAKPVKQTTKGQPGSQVVRQIGEDLVLKLEIDAAASAALRTGEAVAEELSGLSSGTALAAVLRPHGLALLPSDEGGELRLRVVAGRQADPAWPVGWPPEASARETLPKLFEFLQVEIARTPLDKALEALQGRLEVPFLVDHNALASRQIELTQIQVAFPAKRSFYQRILDRVLYQAGLEAQLRVDEAKRPFIWITTVRPTERK